jgi:hypothetical protein
MFDISVHSPIWLLWRRDPFHEWCAGRDLRQGRAAWRRGTRIKRHHGMCFWFHFIRRLHVVTQRNALDAPAGKFTTGADV